LIAARDCLTSLLLTDVDQGREFVGRRGWPDEFAAGQVGVVCPLIEFCSLVDAAALGSPREVQDVGGKIRSKGADVEHSQVRSS